ncbi:alpha/beta hydrolase [Dactylosporangium sp. AC04546]|uniref:alpha/beta hydrolase n=1 Tax=Dactylosporangium sp. AC04546 TaxID=2862460 RepID=UPI001EDFC367|nr:alpha/beta hydrolase [Dactylosporangium sp. AC04546]WVK87415.1 alpha/beta hydrolase [Dactylosporangium sp. AC04546]
MRRRAVLTALTVALVPAAGTLLAPADAVPPAERIDERSYAANKAAMDAAGPPYAGRDGQFLLFDLRGRGRVAEVFGDLDTARRIAVLVPGAGNRADNFWRGVASRPHRSPSRQASDLQKATSIAVIAWLGYDTPAGIDVSAFREDLAHAGAAALERFIGALTTAHPRATVALLGHSYGGTVIGLAARRLPSAVTDLVVFGCPGMGAATVRGLGTTARVWAALSPHDPMRFVPGVRIGGLGHGRRPVDPAFGARLIPAATVQDHDHYLAPGTDAQEAIAHIARHGGDQR